MVLLGSEYTTLSKGDSAPDFSLVGVDGKSYSLADFKDAKALLVVFMCNHCPFVHPRINELKRIAGDYASKGLFVVGINSNDATRYESDSYENMKIFSEEEGLNFPYLYDESQSVARAYGAVCTPDPFLFDQEGKLIFHSRIDDVHGDDEVGVHEMHEVIGEFLATGQITAQENPSMGCSIKWKHD